MKTPTRKPCEAQPELWFSDDPADQYEAAQACGFCPLAAVCESYGDGEIYGVWGSVLRGRTRQVVQPFMATCGWEPCSTEFIARSKSALYCSASCGKQAAKARARERYASMPRCQWEHCRKPYAPKMKSQRFCSVECGRLHKRKTAREAAATRKRMESGHELLNELVQAAS